MFGMVLCVVSGDGFGFVRDVMCMVGDFGGFVRGVRVERGWDLEGMLWERRDVFLSGGGGDGWGDSIMGVVKMFI